jgi:hypothetical protein
VPRKEDDDRPWRKRRDEGSEDERDEDRPRKKRRDEDEERDEDRPRKKRRDDDEDEERPRRRRRDEDEDEDEDDFEYDRGRRRRMPRADLRAIAGFQKGIIFCILAYVGVVIAQFGVPEDVRLWVILLLVPVGITATVFVFLLATKVYGSTTGVVYAVLTLVPLIGLIMLLVINGKATALMKENGIHVGLLGARSSDI